LVTRVAILYALLLAVLVATSRVQRVGDGGEYMAMALNLSAFEPPSLSRDDLARATAAFRAMGNGYEVVPLEIPSLRGRDGRQDFYHFWLTSLFAVPALWIVRAAGLHPNHAFTAVNLLFLIAAAAIVSRRLDAAAAWLIMAGPIVWWTDKATNDAVTFSLVAMAFAQLDRAPWWSLAALGASAALNPALGVVCAIAGVYILARDARARRNARIWVGALAGAAIAVLPIVYYERRLGVGSPLFGWTSPHVPEARELAAFLIDPDIGLLIWFPLLLPALVVAMLPPEGGSHNSREHSNATLLAIAAAVALLCAFAQSTNVNHGGTPSINRWTLWLVPLTIPLFALAARNRGTRSRALVVIAALSSAWSIFAFHPARSEDYVHPSALSAYVWRVHPGWWNPPPEIFAERASRREPPQLPAAAPGCTKALIVDGRFPPGCAPPASIEERCAAIGAICYANRRDGGYDYVKLRSRRVSR
jgi:hypothetical protein